MPFGAVVALIPCGPVQVSVPPASLSWGRMERVTRRPETGPLLSDAVTTGWAVSGDPPVPSPGCVVNARSMCDAATGVAGSNDASSPAVTATSGRRPMGRLFTRST